MNTDFMQCIRVYRRSSVVLVKAVGGCQVPSVTKPRLDSHIQKVLTTDERECTRISCNASAFIGVHPWFLLRQLAVVTPGSGRNGASFRLSYPKRSNRG